MVWKIYDGYCQRLALPAGGWAWTAAKRRAWEQRKNSKSHCAKWSKFRTPQSGSPQRPGVS